MVIIYYIVLINFFILFCARITRLFVISKRVFLIKHSYNNIGVQIQMPLVAHFLYVDLKIHATFIISNVRACTYIRITLTKPRDLNKYTRKSL